MNFTNKRLKVFNPVEDRLDQIDDLGFLLLNLKSSYPIWAEISNYKSPTDLKKEAFDYYIIIRTVLDDEIVNTYLFEKRKKNQFELIYTNSIHNIISK